MPALALGISIHALREEGDGAAIAQFVHVLISIHALREEGDQPVIEDDGRDGNISIHALREEGDTGIRHYVTSADGFLSTPSARRATQERGHRAGHYRISIHALREEGDQLPDP